MTDKEKIRGRIENWFNICLKRAEIVDADYWNAKADAYRNVLLAFDALSEEPVSEDLEEKAKRYAIAQVLCTTDTRMCEQAYLSLRIFNGYDVACAYKDGAESHREQMMKEAIEGLVVCDEKLTHGYRDIVFKIPDNLQVGDKVKLIIIKEE